ncbi:hypothetical protein FB563_6369 [Streptomyces puniciscabiei]|uniref:Short subunit dehydrogenase n=1 Tax=Streptomyces puniciscabiei TaxID=164348 RepID=A0A542THF8_9ACTN|nr:hypothetical protein [Streptomyces puniciscabiei]TQK86256.1 hypothetical protein FB563_6369 [Streptomyces puniciscabiei]
MEAAALTRICLKQLGAGAAARVRQRARRPLPMMISSAAVAQTCGPWLLPVLNTGAGHLDAPLAFSVKGPVAAVNAVLPGMRALGRGTLLFVNGGSAVRPHPERAGTSIAYAAESAYARMLHDALAPENIHATQLIIAEAIRPDAEHSSPALLARRLYDVHRTREGFPGYLQLASRGLTETHLFARWPRARAAPLRVRCRAQV